MTFQPIKVANYRGLIKNKKPFLLLDNAFQEIVNAYIFREVVKKREGIKLIGRLRRVFSEASIGNSSASEWFINTLYSNYTPAVTPEANAEIEPGSVIITIQAGGGDIVFTDQGDGTLTSVTAGNSGRINYLTGEVWLTHTAGAGIPTVAEFAYFPSLPVMGIKTQELAAINVEQPVFFDTKYAYTHSGNDFEEMASTLSVTWSGTDADFFTQCNYRGTLPTDRLFFVNNFFQTDPIRYHNGVTWATLQPDLDGTNFLFQCRVMVSYYGRLLVFNTYEGTTAGTSLNYFNRCRFSQVGNPLDASAWLQNEFGRGGFIDAPTNEAIVYAKFYKNVLIVFFERSTWILNYQGEYGTPFFWERVSTDFGSESPLSTILFDEGVLTVGNRAIINATSNSVQRIDLEVPDEVFNFHNQNGGKERVAGIREFQKELVYWCYSDGGVGTKFPNRVLVYNYRNNTWAKFRDNVTAFGNFTSQLGESWDEEIPWDSNVSWDSFYQGEFPFIVSGNQHGFIHYYQYPIDLETDVDSTTGMDENESLTISDITRSATATLQITVYNHNFESNEIIYINGLNFVDTSTNTALTSSLNDKFYQVIVVDDDTLDLYYWNFLQQSYQNTSGDEIGFTPATGTGEYYGGGKVTLIPKLQLRTKDFNPFQDEGFQVMMNRIDFQIDATANGAVTVNVIVDSDSSVTGNLLIGNKQTNTSLFQSGTVVEATNANPCVIKSFDHGLRNGEKVTFTEVQGMTELNNNEYTVTFVDLDHFSIDVDSSAFGTFGQFGKWTREDPEYYYVPGSNYAYHRFYSSVFGQYISVYLTYDDNLMNTLDTHYQKVELNSFNLYVRKAGRLP